MDFVEAYHLFLDFTDRISWNNFPKISQSNQKVGFVVTPWIFTQVPWYSVTLALLYRNKGCDVSFIWDDLLFNDEQGTKQQNFYINNILERLKDHIPTLHLSQMPILPITNEDEDEIRRLAFANAVWATRSSVPSKEMEYFSTMINKNLKQNMPSIYGLVNSTRFDHMVVPGGIFGNSGLYLKAGRKSGSRVATFDSGFGDILIGVDDVAAYQMDISKLLEPDSIFFKSSVKQKAISLALNEFHLRKEGKDIFKSQAQPYSQVLGQFQYDILIPFNIEWDAAQLNKHLFLKVIISG